MHGIDVTHIETPAFVIDLGALEDNLRILGQVQEEAGCKILLALKGAGLVRSKRGAGGGYVLARDPTEINLAQIVSAVDGPIQAGDFGEPHSDGACDHEGQCVLLAIWADVGSTMRKILSGFTLAELSAMTRGDSPWPD